MTSTSKFVPPPSLEYFYYGQVFYSIMAPVMGLSFSFLGLAMLALLFGLCALRMGSHLGLLIRPVAAALGCGVSFIAVQTLAHGASLGNQEVREFIPWMIGLATLQWLVLRRGFLHRFAIAILLVGVSTLPYLRSFGNDASRVGLDKNIPISNPNDLGAWFGFCCAYFIILGLETRRHSIRAISWVIAMGCLVVVGLTVSRAPLFAVACSTVFAGRRLLKRGFFPVLALIVLAWIAYGLGFFERSANMYAHRGLEETGRFLVWPLAIARFRESPLVGVGASHINTFIPAAGLAIAPHNVFIFIALASGIVPLLFFMAYWVQLFIEAFKINFDSHEDGPFQTSLLIYSFLIANNLNGAFMVPWMMGTLATVTGAGFIRRAMRLAAPPVHIDQTSRHREAPALPTRSRA